VTLNDLEPLFGVILPNSVAKATEFGKKKITRPRSNMLSTCSDIVCEEGLITLT